MGRKTKDSGVDGLLVVDKPAGWTSHDVVAKARGVFGQRRCGHSGTLDPDATGVLLIGFGNVTKLLAHLTALRKTYTGEIVLGTSTSTLDASGEVTGTFAMGHVTLDDVRAAATALVGSIRQTPPMVSALSIGGVRLHELARQGIEVEREARPVEVYRFDVTGVAASGVFSIEVECGSGTYIRSLAADVGTALGGGAHLRHLRRPRIGSFVADGAPSPDTWADARLLTPAEAMRDYPSAALTDADVGEIRHGRRVATSLPDAPVVALLDPSGALVGVAGALDGLLRPTTVFARPNASS